MFKYYYKNWFHFQRRGACARSLLILKYAPVTTSHGPYFISCWTKLISTIIIIRTRKKCSYTYKAPPPPGTRKPPACRAPARPYLPLQLVVRCELTNEHINAQYTPLTPTRRNCRVASRRRCEHTRRQSWPSLLFPVLTSDDIMTSLLKKIY